MSQQDSGANAAFALFIWIGVGSILFTVICDVWIHWLPVGLALLVTTWFGQSVERPRPDNRKDS